MARALRLATRGMCTTHPNPRVGCVIAKDGHVLAEAWHHRAGEPHAEKLALQAAGEAARGATVYLNLEPCCHQGRTPPCTDALIDAGVARVVAALQDPNPQVAGGGISVLRTAGIDVEVGLLAEQAEALNRGFIMRMRHGRPWVTLKLGASLDGRTAMATGESRWITGEAARRDVHRLRARSSAVLTGIGTVLADDPSLTVRLHDVARQPLRVIVDSNLSTPLDAEILAQDGDVLIATAVEDDDFVAGLGNNSVEVSYLPGPNGVVDLVALMDQLAMREINEVLVETGPTLAGALLEARCVDELIVYIAPSLLGDDARGMFHLRGVKELAQRVQLHINDIRQVGEDVRITARVQV